MEARARSFLEATYLVARAQYPIDPELVVAGLLSSLDFANPKTAWSLALLGLTSLSFVVWLELGVRRAIVGQGLFQTRSVVMVEDLASMRWTRL